MAKLGNIFILLILHLITDRCKMSTEKMTQNVRYSSFIAFRTIKHHNLLQNYFNLGWIQYILLISCFSKLISKIISLVKDIIAWTLRGLWYWSSKQFGMPILADSFITLYLVGNYVVIRNVRQVFEECIRFCVPQTWVQ